MYADNMATGDTIRILRNARGISRADLAEKIGISESHMNKIEAGSRSPSIKIYERIIEVLGAKLVIRKEAVTIQERCVETANKILRNSTEKQAVFMTSMLEHMAQNMDLIN